MHDELVVVKVRDRCEMNARSGNMHINSPPNGDPPRSHRMP